MYKLISVQGRLIFSSLIKSNQTQAISKPIQLCHRSLSVSTVRSKYNSTVIQEKVKVDENLEINYGRTGQGPQIVLCIPGVFGTIETDFEPIMKQLNPEKFTILCLDPPGYGKSRPPQRQVGKNPYVKDALAIAKLMKTLDIHKYSILGWSNGGTTGVHVVADNPSNVEKLVIWGSPAVITDFSVKLVDMMADPINWIPQRWKMMVDIYGEEEMKRMLQDFQQYVVDCKRNESFRVDLLLPAIKIPTLILHGKKDMMCPLDSPQLCHEGIENSILEVWPQGQHDLHLEFQDRFVKRVETFLLTAK